jgi:hypothetical protein
MLLIEVALGEEEEEDRVVAGDEPTVPNNWLK